MSGVLTERQRRDRDRYHPSDPADYGSVVGVPYLGEDGSMFFACVGCFYCMPDEDGRTDDA